MRFLPFCIEIGLYFDNVLETSRNLTTFFASFERFLDFPILVQKHTDLEAGAVKKKRTWNETNSIIKVVHQVTRIH